MPFAENTGTKIHYHVVGNGQDLVMLHGFTSSISHWDVTGYVKLLSQQYRLILIDARGHGQSDKPHNVESYKLKTRVNDVTAVLDSLGVGRTHFHGYSMGGRIGFGMLIYATKRLNSMIIGGMHPYVGVDQEAVVSRWSNLLSEGSMETVVSKIENKSGPMPPSHRARFLNNDPKALYASINAMTDMQEVAGAITGHRIPFLMYVGEVDEYYEGVRKFSDSTQGCRLVTFPGLGHLQVSRESEKVVPHIKSFLAEISRDRL